MVADDLIPPPEMLHDGSGSIEEFIHGGPGFLYHSLVTRAALRKEHAVLDIGSGNGKHARVLADFLTTGRYEGFDIVRETVLWCQEHYARFPNFRFHHADIYSDWYNKTSPTRASDYLFPFEDSVFDVAFAASLFTHLMPDETAQYLRQAWRVLKPGGRLVMTCYLLNPYNRFTPHKVQGRRFNQVSYQHFILDPAAPSRGVAYDEAALRTMVRDAGLLVCEITYGRWANGVDVLDADQDIIVAVKPVDPTR